MKGASVSCCMLKTDNFSTGSYSIFIGSSRVNPSESGSKLRSRCYWKEPVPPRARAWVEWIYQYLNFKSGLKAYQVKTVHSLFPFDKTIMQHFFFLCQQWKNNTAKQINRNFLRSFLDRRVPVPAIKNVRKGLGRCQEPKANVNPNQFGGLFGIACI